MEKLDKSDGQSMDTVADNIAKLKELFPEILTENKIDFDTLKALLGEEVETDDERYSFNWNGKAQVRRLAQSPSTGTLRPCIADSKDWDTTQNLFIEGDNLEVLKLLQKSYHKRVKMIYIDPPYNTGSDFVYPDNFHDNIHNYLELTGQIEDGKKISPNTEASGRYHTDWLNMIYPRIKVARNLLTDDGVMFVSIGVQELANLKYVMNEIFGEDNFVEIFSWVKTSTPPALSTKSRKTNEYIICYEKIKNTHKYQGEPLDGGDQPLLNSGNSVTKLVFPKDKVFFSPKKFPNGLLAKQKPERVALLDDIYIHDGFADRDFTLEGEFKWTQKFLEEELKNGTTFIIKSEQLSIRFIRDEDGFKRPTNFIKEKYTSPVINKPSCGVGTNENASSHLNSLLGGDYFDYPKPLSLIQYLSKFATKHDDLILDFFAGSSTTAEAIYRNNLEGENWNQKFIMVQLPEPLDTTRASDANQKEKIEAGIKFLESLNHPANLAELSKERLRRAASEIKEENPSYQGDLGFKVFKLDSSNLKPWDADFDSLAQDLAEATEVVKAERSAEDVLFEILLKYGLDLTLPIATHTLEGKTVYEVGAGALVVCLDSGITEAVAEAIGKLKETLEPEVMRVVFKDSGFANDAAKVNAVQVLKQFGIDDVKSI